MKKILGILSICIIAVMVFLTANSTAIASNATLSSLAVMNSDDGEDGGSGGCTATATCYFGTTPEGSVSCSGTKSCKSGYEYVNCDGVVGQCV